MTTRVLSVFILCFLAVFAVLSSAAFGFFVGWWSGTCLTNFGLIGLLGFTVGWLGRAEQWHTPIDVVRGWVDRHYAMRRVEARAIVAQDEDRRKLMSSRRRRAIELLTDGAIDDDGVCKFCGSRNANLLDYPFDYRFHRNGCPVVPSRLTIAQVEMADDEVVASSN